jgi:hypothetical protein
MIHYDPQQTRFLATPIVIAEKIETYFVDCRDYVFPIQIPGFQLLYCSGAKAVPSLYNFRIPLICVYYKYHNN